MTHRFIRMSVVLLVAFFVTSSAVAFDPRHVFITNRLGGNVIELDENLSFVRVWFDGESFEGSPLASPNGMAFTPNGEMFLADTQNNRVVAFDGAGGFVRAFSTLPRMAQYVESIAFDRFGVLYASANTGNGTVARYEQDGTDLPDVVSAPLFLSLSNVNLTREETILVSDFSRAARGLRELDPANGEIVRTFGTELSRQEDVALDGADRVIVTHYDANEVVVYGPAPDREELYRFGAPEEAELEIVQPTGIALTHDCKLLVSSFENGAIFIFKYKGDEPPEFDRVLRPGEEIPESANLGLTESIAIAGLGLPGSFLEFEDRVPACDGSDPPPPAPIPDAGVLPDASQLPDASPDADMTAPAAPLPDDGCGCTVADERSVGFGALYVLALAVMLRRRRVRRFD